MRSRKLLAWLPFVTIVALIGILGVAFLKSSSSNEQYRHARHVYDMIASPLNSDFTWTIFITPEGFVGDADHRQRRAIESWLRLKPQPKIVLVGQGEGYDTIAKDYGVDINPHLDLNLVMMPLAGSLVDTAMKADTDVSVILNSDIILTQSLPDAIAKVNARFPSWFLSGARYDLQTLPDFYDVHDASMDESSLVQYVRTRGVLHTAGGVDYFVWNNNGQRLIHGPMPPFIRGKSKFDNWLVHEVIQAGYRSCVDATDSVTVIHVDHSYKSAVGKVSQGNTGKSTFWMKSKTQDWQIFHNYHLAIAYGSYRNQDGTTMHSPYKLVSCMEESSNNMCMTRRVRPGLCACEHSPFALNTQTDPEVVHTQTDGIVRSFVKCAGVSPDRADKYVIPVQTKEGHDPVYGLPFTLTDLLPLVARNKRVILTGASYTYRDVVMNFVCNLRRLGIYDMLVIAAFDEEMYRFGFRMGLPIFYYQSDDLAGASAREMEYGSKHFKRVTKLKSQVVLRILKLGYEVLWTDTDIVWFQDPTELLKTMPSDFVVQSNAPYPDEKEANGPLRINSGFYRVRSTPITIAAMEKIVEHAAESSLTEQPSFYIILCGGKEGENKQGPDTCHYTDPDIPGSVLEVSFLDRMKYPAGAVSNIWEHDNIRKDFPNLVILHNNWIRGIRAKIDRVMSHGFWYYNRQEEICDYSAKTSYSLDWTIDEHGEE